jgi:RNA polymerase sigma-70 factor (ECF subfamily)
MADVADSVVAEIERPVPDVDWNEALGAHHSWLRSVVAARLEEPQAVEEVLQEVALAVIANRAPLSDAEKLAPWLYQIAVRQTLLYRRKHGRHRKLVGNYATHIRPTEADARVADPLTWLLADEQAELIRSAFQQLPDRDREILFLKYNHSWSYKRISDYLGVSHSAVEARLHRARKRLRSRLIQLDVISRSQPTSQSRR